MVSAAAAENIPEQVEEELDVHAPPRPGPSLDKLEVLEHVLPLPLHPAQTAAPWEKRLQDLQEPVRWPRALAARQLKPQQQAQPVPQPATPAEAEAPAPVDDESDDCEPVLLEAPAPRYPSAARRFGWEGTVVCRILVRVDGSVGQVTVERSSGHDSLDEAARNAIRTWRFKPGLRAGGAAELEFLHRVLFRLNGGG